MKANKKILDACCGGRMFWFDKKNPHVLYIDNDWRGPFTVGRGRNARQFECKPDRVMDFRRMKFGDGTFHLVVFDPPHFYRAGEKSYMGIKYGRLRKDEWGYDLKAGFAECFRVLKRNGVLIFKWNETHIPLSRILPLAYPHIPLFGHRSGSRQRTHWICFMKY